MDFSNLTALTPKPEAEAPLITRTIKKNQLPACDTFGPFPDETVLSGIDRLLFLMGAQRIQRLLNLPQPCFDMVPSDASINVEAPPDSARSCCTMITESSCCSCPSRKASVRKCCCPKCSARSSVRVKIVEAERSEKPPTPRKSFQPLKRSFSLCSLACRKLRQVCFLSSKNQCPSDASNPAGSLGGMGGKLSGPKWIWTRMFSHPSGCEIYEVYKNSCTCMHPSQIKIKSSPKLIFVVLPNGLVMPFETISCH